MKIKQHLGFISMLAIAFTACQQKPAETDNFLENEIKNIEAQHTLQTDLIEKSGKILNPRTIDEKGNIVYVPIDDWTSGFFPGTMWLDYDLTKDEKWKKLAEEFGTDPSQLYAAIGPSICQECYEVSEDVIEEFEKVFDKKYWNRLFYRKENGKFKSIEELKSVNGIGENKYEEIKKYIYV